MLLVKAYTDKSTIHGIGLFAGERIPKGTLIWQFNPGVDWLISEADVMALPKPEHEDMQNHSYFVPLLNARVVCGDDARYLNHHPAPHATCCDTEVVGCTTAARDIEIGEELTCDYHKFTTKDLSGFVGPIRS